MAGKKILTQFNVGGSVGTAGQVLTSGGSGTSMSWSGSAGCWIRLESVTAGATDQEVELTAFSDTYNTYKVVVDGGFSDGTTIAGYSDYMALQIAYIDGSTSTTEWLEEHNYNYWTEGWVAHVGTAEATDGDNYSNSMLSTGNDDSTGVSGERGRDPFHFLGWVDQGPWSLELTISNARQTHTESYGGFNVNYKQFHSICTSHTTNKNASLSESPGETLGGTPRSLFQFQETMGMAVYALTANSQPIDRIRIRCYKTNNDTYAQAGFINGTFHLLGLAKS